MGKERDKIIELSADIAVSETSKNQICPFCKGGVGGERSLSITRLHNGVLYNCYRASCGSTGFIGSDNVVYTTSRAKREKEEKAPMEYNHPTFRLARRDVAFFSSNYEITEQELLDNNITWCLENNSYTFPLFDYRGYQFGVQDRAYWGRKPKAISYWFNHNTPKVHFPASYLNKDIDIDENIPLLIVEDILSAIKAGRYMDSCAILGTALTEEIAHHLSYVANHIILALDNDAVKKAVNYRRKYGILFKKFEILVLDKDIKDTPHEKLQEIFK